MLRSQEHPGAGAAGWVYPRPCHVLEDVTWGVLKCAATSEALNQPTMGHPSRSPVQGMARAGLANLAGNFSAQGPALQLQHVAGRSLAAMEELGLKWNFIFHLQSFHSSLESFY